jgi:DNA-binding SARP family transcriptional activator
MVRLSLDFLGTFQVVLDERPITRFRSSNVQGLLVYLALNADRPTARDQLAVLFWPEESESVARSNLRQSLYQLKKILNDGDDGKTSFLLINRQTVQLNAASSIRIDVLDFLAFIEKGELGEAAALYNGDLLPGYSGQSLEFEEWLRVERV